MILMILVLIFVTAIIAGIVYLVWLQNFSSYSAKTSTIPGPSGYPLIGCLLEYTNSTQEEIFKTDVRFKKKYGVIYKHWLLHHLSVFMTHPDDLEILLSSSVQINKSVLYQILQIWLGTGLLTSGKKKWQKRRKMLTPAFHFAILQAFIPIFNKETKKLVQKFKELVDINSCVDVMEPISQYTLLSIAETSMGIKLDSFQQKCDDYKTAVYVFGETSAYRMSKPWLFNDLVYSWTSVGQIAYETAKKLHKFSRDIIAERKKKFTTSNQNTEKKMTMLDLLLQNNGVDIDDEGIAEEVDTFIFEGHDTTALGLTYTLLCLANNPAIQQQVYEEIKTVLGDKFSAPSFGDLKDLSLMERCIKESLRLFPSVPLISREVSEDFKTSTGHTIPKGAWVHTYIFHLHRNPEFFPNPQKFDPDRFLPENAQKRHPFSYLPFSAGPRNCIGQRYAMLELKAALCGILEEFILEPVDRLEEMVFISDLVLRSKEKVRIHFKRRNM